MQPIQTTKFNTCSCHTPLSIKIWGWGGVAGQTRAKFNEQLLYPNHLQPDTKLNSSPPSDPQLSFSQSALACKRTSLDKPLCWYHCNGNNALHLPINIFGGGGGRGWGDGGGGGGHYHGDLMERVSGEKVV